MSSELYPIDSEAQVIGGLLKEPTLRKYISSLNADDFSSGVYASLYEKIARLYREKTFDYAMIINACEDDQDERAAVVDTVEGFLAVSTFPEHVSIIQKAAQARRIREKINRIIEDGNYSLNALQRIISDEEENKAVSSLEASSSKGISSFVSGLNRDKGAQKTGFSEFDYLLGGIRRGTLFVIGARPSTGKTTFALNIARNLVQAKKKIVFYSLEMQSEMIFEKYAADVCGIENNRFSRNSLTPSEIASVTGLMKSLDSAKRLVVADDRYTIESICSSIREELPDVAVVDYVQRIRSVKDFKSTRELVNYITSELKITAKQTGVCIILLSQISRGGSDYPRMSDLKESGALEEDGDYIALLHRPFVLDKTGGEEPEKTLLLLDKNKFGACGSTTMFFNLPFQRFTEVKNGYFEC